ncbi:MAG: ABC transporter ATP-binding protein, partial [Deltaproteobacteria bacterium]
LLDEPTNHLDLDSLTWLENFLAVYNGALVIISHDRAFLDRVTSQTVELSLGKLTSYKGNYSFFVREKAERRAVEKAAYNNQQAKIKQTMRFVERFRAKSTKAKQVQSRVKQLEKMDIIELAEDEQQIKFQFPPAPDSGRDVLAVDNLHKGFNGKAVFREANFQLQRGDKVAVIGVNGAGKSTLLRILAGQLEQDQGRVKLGARVNLSYFGQHQAQELPEQFTALEIMGQVSEGLTITRIRSLLGAFLFRGEDVDKKAAVLSGGEKSRLALARMIATPANLMLLDEPTNHLDMSSQEVLQEAMSQYDGTIIVVSHNRYFVDSFINKVLEIRDGRITLHEGNVAEYLARMEEIQKNSRPENKRMQETGKKGGKENRKKQRKLEAERRKERNRRIGPLKKELDEAESKVEELEQLKDELESRMADPELYQDETAWVQISKDYEDCKRRLERWYNKWETTQQEIDRIDADLGG